MDDTKTKSSIEKDVRSTSRGTMDRGSVDDMVDETIEETVVAVQGDTAVNASGYRDQLKRQYGLLGLAGIALTIDNAWVALGSTVSVSLLNGGPPGIIWGLPVAVFYYSFIGLGLAEFASAVPTAGGVYHWATIAGGPSWGRMMGFFTGWINFYGWMFDLASLLQISANIAVEMYSIYHRDTYQHAAWHVYVAYVGVTLISGLVVMFANRAIPWTQHAGMFLVLAGGIVTIAVLSAMPVKHASHDFVWTSFERHNDTGWPSGMAFLLGVLNGAFTIGTPDAVTHLAEELPHPGHDLPKAIGLQIGLGFVYAFCFAVALCYSISDLDALQGGVNSFPLANIYAQATARPDGTTRAGAVLGLLFIIWCSSLLCCIGTITTNSRTYWALARDKAVPFSDLFASVHERLSCPIPATVFVCVVAVGLGAVPLGSSTAFLDLTGSFIILSTVSYAIPFAAHVLTGRRHFPRGPFHLGPWGTPINVAAVAFIVFFGLLYCFPFTMPTSPDTMNYSSVILAGTVGLTAAWWFAHAREHYPGPKVMDLYMRDGKAVAT